MSDPKFEELFVPTGASFKLEPIQTNSFTVCAGTDKTYLTFTQDGQIIIGDGFTPDEAGRAAIEAMRHQLSFIIDAAVKAEREACAKAAEDQIEPCEPYDREGRIANAAFGEVAIAIRARKDKP